MTTSDLITKFERIIKTYSRGKDLIFYRIECKSSFEPNGRASENWEKTYAVHFYCLPHAWRRSEHSFSTNKEHYLKLSGPDLECIFQKAIEVAESLDEATIEFMLNKSMQYY